MRLTLRIKVPATMRDPRAWWTAEDALAVGISAAELMRVRTEQGIGADGKPFKPYSTRGPVYINPNRGIGRALAPKGGKWSRTGRTMRFADYGEYKLLSRGFGKGAAYATGNTPTLSASGRMLDSLRARSYTRTQVLVGVGDETASYAAGVNELRPFVGVADKDLDLLVDVAAERIARRLAIVFGGGQT